MKKIFISFLLSLIICRLSPASAPAPNAFVRMAEEYLNGVTGLYGEFAQTSNGKKDRGTFSMLRPGRVRLDYKTLPIQLISNGKDLYFYDRSLDQITTVPLTSTPAGILVRKNINLSTADIAVSDVAANESEFSLKMQIRGQEGVGNMRIVFSRNPVALKSWIVTDATGTETEVAFEGMRVRSDFPKNHFELQKMKTTAKSGDSYYD